MRFVLVVSCLNRLDDTNDDGDGSGCPSASFSDACLLVWLLNCLHLGSLVVSRHRPEA